MASSIGNGVASVLSSGIYALFGQVVPAVNNMASSFNATITSVANAHSQLAGGQQSPSSPMTNEGSKPSFSGTNTGFKDKLSEHGAEINPDTVEPLQTLPLSSTQRPFGPTPVLMK